MKVISVENVSKKFILAHDRPKNLADAARGMFHRTKREDFWALKDVSFDVEQGEALGIIGHNGAGKSTMLKLLTRIMEPTSGRIRTRGRVSALIEVGAGFHPEMTGRENVYLNGSILGMTRAEIDKKFDEIVAFAELEKFIDTPVKRYSSGMYARLGFAVAAHVDPEILIVDEVLSVGDAAFQERCTRHMKNLRNSNKTIIFVSHNMGAVASLCDKVAVLDHGTIKSITDPETAIKEYRESVIFRNRHSYVNLGNAGDMSSQGSPMVISDVEMIAEERDWTLRVGDPLKLKISYDVNQVVAAPRIGIQIQDSVGQILAHTSNALTNAMQDIECSGCCNVSISNLPLVPGAYILVIKVADTYGSIVYDDGGISRDLFVLPPSEVIETGAPRFGNIWIDATWEYQDAV